MNLWWLFTSNYRCSYDEIKARKCIAIGWPELESLSRYIKDKPGWERQFKTFVQLRGNLAYTTDKNWLKGDDALSTGVPNIFWNLIHIKKGDFVVVMESGNQLTLGNVEIRGIAEVTQNAITSYKYDKNYHHAHQVCDGLNWQDWNTAKFSELDKPQTSFKSILMDDDQLARVEEVWNTMMADAEIS